MSVSASTRTKSLSDTIDSESTESPLVYDRWTNNISYRQLVVSSCIGIFQIWWHPYLHDFRRLLPFLFLYNVFSIVIGYPLFYLELALGVVTKKGVLKCWDLAPMARGMGFAMLSTCVFCALAAGTVAAWCLALTVHSFHTFLPWLHCAAAARPPCAARHRPLPVGSETPPQSFFFNFVLDLKREGLSGGLGNVVWELTIYYVICWLLIYFIVIKRIYSYSKLVLFKDVLTYLVLICALVGALQLQGANRIFKECDWNVLLDSFQMWREALEYALIEMTVCQGSLVMLGSYCPKSQHKLGTTAVLAFAVSKSTTMTTALALGATHGALYKDYENSANIWPGSSASIVLWSDLVARIPGSQFWSALIFFTLFVSALTTTALLVQTVMSSFTGQSIRKISWAFLILICLLFCLIGVLTLCTQINTSLPILMIVNWLLSGLLLLGGAKYLFGSRLNLFNKKNGPKAFTVYLPTSAIAAQPQSGLYIMNFLMNWPASKARVPIAALMATVITYVYGQTMFCEDVFFAVGEYPSVFMRVCWAISPAIMMIIFTVGGTATWSGNEALAGWLLVGMAMVPIALVMLVYAVFKFRVRNIVREGK